MPSPSYIITPAGNVVAASGGGNPVLSGNTVTWNGVVEPFPSVAAAQTYFTNLTGLIAQQATASAFTQNMNSPVLFSISPGSFEMPTAGATTPFATTHLTINGVGFLPSSSYVVGVEDDFTIPMIVNGYRLTAIYVNSTTLIVDAGNSGNAILNDGACYVFLYDFTSNIASIPIVAQKTSQPGWPVIVMP